MNHWGLIAVAFAVLITGTMFYTAGWDIPPVDEEQTGYRGTAMVQVYDRETVADLQEANVVPEAPWEADPEGERAGDVYENVQVLGHLSDDQFQHIMAAITEWVSPEQGCAYCHNEENFADDNVYTKIVARRMFQKTWYINQEWGDHVGGAGVTCYTCHRGQPVPEYIWFEDTATPKAELAWRNEQNVVAEYAGNSSLPYDHLTSFLLGDRNIRVHGDTALPTGNTATIMDTEWTYALMIHMSESLGVNCTYCHNSRAFNDWDQSPPARVTAWHGIRMARDLNNKYLVPLQHVYPEQRLGPNGDAPKVNCTTCHQGVNKPLYGENMVQDYMDALSGEGLDAAPDADVVWPVEMESSQGPAAIQPKG